MSEDQQLGRKFDKGKARWDLVPWEQFKEVVDILTFGSMKYEDNNWKYVKGGRERYFRAMISHAMDYRIAVETGQPELKNDPLVDEHGNAGSGKSHLAHVICNALFLMWFDNQDEKNANESTEMMKRLNEALQNPQIRTGLEKPQAHPDKLTMSQEQFDRLDAMDDTPLISSELKGNGIDQDFAEMTQTLDHLLQDSYEELPKKVAKKSNVDPMMETQEDLVATGVRFSDLPESDAEPMKAPDCDLYDPNAPIKENSEAIFERVQAEEHFRLLDELANTPYPAKVIDGVVVPIPKWAVQNAVIGGYLDDIDERPESAKKKFKKSPGVPVVENPKERSMTKEELEEARLAEEIESARDRVPLIQNGPSFPDGLPE